MTADGLGALTAALPSNLPKSHTQDLSKRKSGGPKEKEKEKKEEDDPNKHEDDHPFRVGASLSPPVPFLPPFPDIHPSIHSFTRACYVPSVCPASMIRLTYAVTTNRVGAGGEVAGGPVGPLLRRH